MKYDARTLRELATRLNSLATWTVYTSTAMGIVVGGALLGVVGGALGQTALGILAGLVAGGVLGYLNGEHKVLMMRMEAQLALCHIEIEENTRAKHVVTVETKTAATEEPEESGSTQSPPEPEPEPESEAQAAEAPPRNAGAVNSMGVDPGEWTDVGTATVPGSYRVDSGNTGIPWVQKAFEAKDVSLSQRYGGLWLEFGAGSGELLSESSFRWATSDKQPGMLLILDSIGNPRVLLRRLS